MVALENKITVIIEKFVSFSLSFPEYFRLSSVWIFHTSHGNRSNQLSMPARNLSLHLRKISIPNQLRLLTIYAQVKTKEDYASTVLPKAFISD